jgi:hypothetical protein
MIMIRPGSPAALLVASIVADRHASKPSRSLPSRSVKRRQGLTTELPARFRRPLIQRQAMRANETNG